MKKTIRNLGVLALTLLSTSESFAQMVGANCYMKGNLVEIGIDGDGGFEGVDTFTSPPLAGMHYRSGTQFFGFVANPQVNAWATFDGDFFTPGSPENGWGFEAISAGGVSTIAGNNCAYLQQIFGSITNFDIDGTCITSDWNGSYVGGGWNIGFHINYFLRTTDLYYTTTVTVTNNGTATIPTFYYYRNFDPDNNQPISGDFTTQNTIISQPGSGCNKAHVRATSNLPASQPMSYVGIAAVGSAFRVCKGGFSNRDGSDIWNATGTYFPALTGTVGATSFDDAAISLGYRILNLAPGASETFKFVIILDDAAANNAINNLFSFSYPGSTGAATVCNPVTDTVTTCPGVPVPIAITGSVISDFNWSWSPTTGLSSSTGPSVNAAPMSSTLYTITGNPINPCFAPVTQQIYVNVTPPPTITVPPPPTICSGGSVSMTASGAGVGGTYSWSPATGLSTTTGATVTANPTTTTTYTVTGTTSAGCIGTTTVTVNVGAGPTITVPNASICNGSSTTLTASGASTYTWSPGTGLSATTGTSVTANPTVTTTYTVTGTTAAGCTGTTTTTVTVNPIPTVTAASATICNGSSTPLTASGASTYTWSPGTGLSATTGTTVTANPTATTTYTITGTSAAGCVGTGTTTVTVNPLPIVTCPSATICPTSSTPLTASGASTYTWSPGTGLSATTGATVTASPASTTTYTITGTSAAGCVGTGTTTVTVGGTITITVPPATICNGSSTTLTASGGSTYTWSPGTGLSATTGTSVTANPTTTTTYTITGTDAAGCSGSTTSTVTVNPIPTVTAASATICNGSSTPLTASGASTYTWSPGTGLSATIGTTVTANPTTTTTYTITGTSAAGCVGTGTTTVTVNPMPVVNVNSASICSGSSATLTATGATTYTWSPGTDLSATTGATVTSTPTATITYTVTGTSLGCSSSATSTVTINANFDPTITTPLMTVCANDPTVGYTAVDAGGTWTATCGTCIDATTGVFNPATASTGLQTITYTIPGACGGTDTEDITVNPVPDVTATPPTATICSGTAPAIALSSSVAGTTFAWTTVSANTTGATNASGTSIADVLTVVTPPTGAATYTVTPTAAGCVGSPIDVTINVENVVINSIDTTGVLCFGGNDGTITINATGASSYSIDGGGSFVGTNVFAVAAGTYPIVVENTLGCQATGTAVVTEPPLLTVAPVFVQDETCFGACDGMVVVAPAGGTAPVSFAWSSGSTSALADLLCTGTYTVVVTDDNGCTATVSQAITGPTAVVINSLVPVQPLCNGGSDGNITVNASGGTLPYDYSNGGPSQTSNIFNSLPSGNYTITVTDAAGCSSTGTVFVDQPALLTATSSPDVTICQGGTTTISVTPAGGTLGYSFLWNDPSAATTATVSVAPTATPTTYSVVVTDNNGCTTTENVVVDLNPGITLTISPDVAICPGDVATISASATGGDGGPYNFVWTSPGGATLTGGTQSVSPTSTTTYTVVVTDGCTTPSQTANTNVTVYPLPAVVFSPSTPVTGCSPVPADFDNLTDPLLSASCLWDFGDGNTSTNCTVSHVYTDPGCYDVTLTVTTVNNCVVTQTVNSIICVYANPVADFTAAPQPADVLNPEINFTNLTIGGATYGWDFDGLGVSNLTNPSFVFPADSGGVYNVCLNVMSAEGCVDTICHEVEIKDQLLIYVPNAFTPDGDGINDIFLPVIQGEEPGSFQLMIFNRWGDLIFQSNNKLIGWDGTHKNMKSKEDVYVWKVKYTRMLSGENKDHVGHVNLLR